MNYWKVYCLEEEYPGLWRRWFKAQCVAVRWTPEKGYHLDGETKPWTRARNALKRMQPGDRIVAQLSENRIGRIGTVTETRVRDDQWDPLVPKGPNIEHGEMGRRINVRWDLEGGPDDPDTVVDLPAGTHLGRGTISRIREDVYKRIVKAMRDKANWVGLSTRFAYERALSDYIALVPHHLEDGLEPYPYKEVREKVFSDGSRSDVLLMDREERPVVVECKKDAPNGASIHQLVRYLRATQKETRKKPRGILVHGGARKLILEVQRELKSVRRRFPIDVVQYELNVHFAPSR